MVSLRAEEPLAGEPQTPPESPDEAAKRIERRLAELEKQKIELDRALVELQEEKARIDLRKRNAAAELGKDIAVEVGDGKSAFVIREVVNAKVAEVQCSDVDILTTYLTRAFNDPKGPKSLRVSAHKDHPYDHLSQVFAACAAAGYGEGELQSHGSNLQRAGGAVHGTSSPHHCVGLEVESSLKAGNIDLTKYSKPGKP